MSNYYWDHLQKMDEGLDKLVLGILVNRKGKDRAIAKYLIQSRVISHQGFEDVDERQIRLSVENMRRQGLRICSDVNGYYLANTEQEYQEFAAIYGKAARSIFKTIRAMDTMKPVLDEDLLEIRQTAEQLDLLNA